MFPGEEDIGSWRWTIPETCMSWSPGDISVGPWWPCGSEKAQLSLGSQDLTAEFNVIPDLGRKKSYTK